MNNEVPKKKNNNGNLIIIIGAVALVAIIAIVLCLFVFKNDNKGKDTNGNNTNENNTPTDVDTIPKEFDYTKGVLHTVKNEPEFVIKGLFLIGKEREDYDYLESLKEEGYKKDGLKTSFDKEEWINIYLDTEYSSEYTQAKAFIVPHKTMEEYQKYKLNELESIAMESGGYFFTIYGPDDRNFNFVGNGYVSKDAEAGLYDILFVYNEEIVYYIVIDVK